MSLSERPEFPQHIDSSIRGSFVSCARKFELEYLHHYKPKILSVHLHAGAAYAKGLEVTRREFYQYGASQEDATVKGAKALIEHYGDFECPDNSDKSLPNMVGALGEYVSHYGLKSDHVQPLMVAGKPAVEFSFALPIDVEHPKTGDPILYVGRCDMLGVHNAQNFIIDDKTTTRLGKTWFTQWVIRGQFTGYVWAARQFNYDIAGCIIRGLAIHKHDYSHAESIQYRQDWEVARWYKQLCRDVERMKVNWREGYFDYDLDSSCSTYGACTFLEVCSSAQPERWLEQDFEKRVWDPINVQEIELDK